MNAGPKWYVVLETLDHTKAIIPSRKHVFHASRNAAERAATRANNRLGFLSLTGSRALIWSSEHPDAHNNQDWQHIYTVAL